MTLNTGQLKHTELTGHGAVAIGRVLTKTVSGCFLTAPVALLFQGISPRIILSPINIVGVPRNPGSRKTCCHTLSAKPLALLSRPAASCCRNGTIILTTLSFGQALISCWSEPELSAANRRSPAAEWRYSGCAAHHLPPAWLMAVIICLEVYIVGRLMPSG